MTTHLTLAATGESLKDKSDVLRTISANMRAFAAGDQGMRLLKWIEWKVDPDLIRQQNIDFI